MIKGNCLCKKVEVQIEETKAFFVCHCDNCRRWTGGLFMSVSDGKALKFSNEEIIGRYSVSGSVELGFCKNGGTNQFYPMYKSDFQCLDFLESSLQAALFLIELFFSSKIRSR